MGGQVTMDKNDALLLLIADLYAQLSAAQRQVLELQAELNANAAAKKS